MEITLVDVTNPRYAKTVVDPLKIELGSIVFTSWHEYNTYYPFIYLHDSTTKANILFNHNVHHAKKFAGDNGFKTYEDQRFFLLKLDPHVALRFKKMDPKGKTSNVSTGRQEDIRKQQVLFLEDVVHVVDVGYVPNTAWSNFKTIRIVLSIVTIKHTVQWEIILGQGLKIVSDLVVGDLFRDASGSERKRRARPRASKDQQQAAGDDE